MPTDTTIHENEMKKRYYEAGALGLGLLMAQLLATMQVYQSNAALYRKLVAIRQAGYITVPNQTIIHSLKEFGPAFFGGLFFTFTVGAGLSVLSFGAAWIWDRLLSRNKSLIIPFILLYIGALVAVNSRGLCPMVTTYFSLIPLTVFMTTLRWMSPEVQKKLGPDRMVHCLSFTLLALLWTSQIHNRMFLDLRDNILLSNPLGTKLNDFYYKYTLYAAEVFKTLNQKINKTCNLDDIQEDSSMRSLEVELLNHDYFCVRGDEETDLRIVEEDQELAFQHGNRTVLRATLQGFLAKPEVILKAFSSKSDKYSFFRDFTYLSLLLGFPIILYIALHTLLRLLTAPFMDSTTSSSIASILCLVIGTVILLLCYVSRSGHTNRENLAEALESQRWQNRVEALRIIEKERIEIASFQVYKSLIGSSYIAERYWLARALGISKQPETYEDLLTLLGDPHPNVVCMALYGLGQRGDTRVVGELVERIQKSEDWYVQWYGYKTLRALGWKQNRSKREICS